MSIIGDPLEVSSLVLTTGRDFTWTFKYEDAGVEKPFPSGKLYFEFVDAAKTIWDFTIAGSKATIKVESEDADKIANRTKWQLVFLPAGEPAGGYPVARGVVRRQQ